jgi:lipopolysaccharide transport system permease protein
MVERIESQPSWKVIDLRELWHYRDLFYLLVWRDLRVLYQQSILGIGWAIIRPIISMLVFTVVFGKLAKLDSEGVPYALFSLLGVLPWTYFASSVANATNSLIGSADLINKVYYPRLLVPLTPILSGLVDFFIGLLIIVVFMVYYRLSPSINLLFLPVLIIQLILFATGLGLWLSSLAVQFRDVKHGVPYFIQVLLYASPVVWSTTIIPSKYQLLYGFYPLAGIIDGFRACIIPGRFFPWQTVLAGFFSTLVLLFLALIHFKRRETFLSDVA